MKLWFFSINRWFKPIFGLFLVNLVVILGGLIINPAYSLTINSSEASSPTTVVKAPPQSSADPWQQLTAKAQTNFEKTRTKLEAAIAELSTQLEQSATVTDTNQQKQLAKALEKRQDALENAADKLDDLAEKLEDVSPKLLKEKTLSADLLSQRQESLQNALNTLNQLVQSVNLLADNTEQAKKQNTPEFRTQIEQQSQEIGQLLDQTQQVLQGFTPNPS